MTTDNSQTFDGNKYPDSSSPDYDLATSFIAEMAMGTHIHLSSFDPSDPPKYKPQTKVFTPRDDPSLASAFIQESVHHGCNTFYCANVGNPHAGAPPKKDSITHLRALVIDIDPEAIPINPAAWKEERLRLKEKIHTIVNGKLPPTWIVDSANGAQLIYQFSGSNPIALNDELASLARDTQRTIAAIYRADKTTATLEHLFRIPGTINSPPKAKLAKGGREGFAGLWLKNGKRWDLKELHAAAKLIADETGRDADDDTHEFKDIPNCRKDLIDTAYRNTLERDFWDDLRRTIRDMREDDNRFDDLFKRLTERPDRSGKDYRFCCLLFKADIAPCDVAYALAAYGACKKPPQSQEWYKYLASTVMRAYTKVKQGDWYDDSPDSPQGDSKTTEPPKAHRWSRFDDEIQADLTVNPLVRNLFGRHGLSMLYGPSNAGKSLAALSFCSAIASQEPIGGHRVNAHDGCTVYVVMEGSGGLRPRLRALKAQYPDRRTDNMAFITGEFDMRTGGKDNGTRLLISTIREIATAFNKPIVFVVIDMLLVASAGANENSSEDMGKVFQNLARLEHEIGCNVLVLHHTGKDDTRGARGWSGMRGRIDTELELSSDTPGYGNIKITKQRDMEILKYPLPFSVISHHVATDAEGQPITGAVAVFDDGSPAASWNDSEIVIHKAMLAIGRKATLKEIVDELQIDNPHIKQGSVKETLRRMYRKRLIGYRTGHTGHPAVYWCLSYDDEEPNDPFN